MYQHKQTSFSSTLSRKHQISGFTLVELVITITILSILAVIGFINIGNYISQARDADRITTIDNIATTFEIAKVKDALYPDPINYTTIEGISKQGYFGPEHAERFQLSKDVLDPKDKTRYIYSVNPENTKAQVGIYLEDNNQILFSSNILPQVYAVNYVNRYFYTKGDRIGILLNSDDSSPLQEKYEDSINLVDTPDNFNAIFGNTQNDQKSGGGGRLGFCHCGGTKLL